MVKCELFNDNFQNFKSYNIPSKAQLVITDIPYNIGNNAYGSHGHTSLYWQGFRRLAPEAL